MLRIVSLLIAVVGLNSSNRSFFQIAGADGTGGILKFSSDDGTIWTAWGNVTTTATGGLTFTADPAIDASGKLTFTPPGTPTAQRPSASARRARLNRHRWRGRHAGNLNGDGLDGLIGGGGPGVLALSGQNLIQGNVSSPAVLANFFAGDPVDRNGVRLAVKDLDGDTRADVAAGSGTGPASRVTAYAGSAIAPAGTPDALFNTAVAADFIGGVFVG